MNNQTYQYVRALFIPILTFLTLTTKETSWKRTKERTCALEDVTTTEAETR
jgi:hypothetical protein